MGYITCLGCHHKAACDEAGACQGAAAVQAQYPALKAIAIARSGGPAPAPAANATPKPAAAPPRVASTPGQGSVTERIFAACNAALAELRAADPSKWGNPAALTQARAVAIPRLEAQGVNSNSARKGSHMWLQAQKEGANQS